MNSLLTTDSVITVLRRKPTSKTKDVFQVTIGIAWKYDKILTYFLSKYMTKTTQSVPFNLLGVLHISHHMHQRLLSQYATSPVSHNPLPWNDTAVPSRSARIRPIAVSPTQCSSFFIAPTNTKKNFIQLLSKALAQKLSREEFECQPSKNMFTRNILQLLKFYQPPYL